MTETEQKAPPGWLVLLLAVSCGLTVANLYYAQPLLAELRQAFGVGEAAAGGVVTAVRGGDTQVLLVRASRPPHRWVLPKGHIEAGETPEETARREVLEEAGVVADVATPIGDISWSLPSARSRTRSWFGAQTSKVVIMSLTLRRTALSPARYPAPTPAGD